MEQSLIDLLYLHDCVVIPDFGGFVARRVSARLEEGVFHPPTKQIVFNSYLKTQDGLLANHIAQKNNCTYERAGEIILNKVTQWLEDLQNGDTVDIKNVGTIVLNKEKTLTFTPFQNTNYLTNAFGLLPVSASVISQQKYKATSSVIFRYAAVIALSFGVGLIWQRDAIFGLPAPSTTDKAVILASPKKRMVKTSNIKKTTLAKPIEKTHSKKIVATSKRHIAVGAFRTKKNAYLQIRLAKRFGFDSHIVPLKSKSLFRVVITVPTAEKSTAIKRIKQNISKNAWLLPTH